MYIFRRPRTRYFQSEKQSGRFGAKNRRQNFSHFAGEQRCGLPKEEISLKNSETFKGAKLPSDRLETNIRYFRDIFTDDDTLVTRNLNSPNRPEQRFCLIYADGMVNNLIVDQDVIRPLLRFRFPEEDSSVPLIERLALEGTFSNSVEKTSGMEQLVQAVVYGDTVLLVDGCAEALILNTKGWSTRSITEPESERVLRGPREGFTESILMNLSMVRRKLRTPDLKMRFRVFGRRTQTKACLCYLDSLVNKSVLQELEKRLDLIDIDGTIDSNYIGEIIKDAPYSAVKTVGSTERPDIVAAKLLEGRVALFLDGTPVALTVPYLFIEHMQSDEDYYINYVFASIGRFLRILAVIVSLILPATYVSLVTFHQEMLPTPLLISIASSRQGVPFPTALETIMMLLVFEMLRESGTRMPGLMGQTLSIVGALVIGQAAVDAKVVSAPIIIIVAFAGICGLMVPRLKGYLIVHRFILLLFSCVLGLYGLMLGLTCMLARLYNIESFGVPIMNDTYARSLQDLKDLYVRAPWGTMKKRPRFLSPNVYRQAESQTGDKSK